MRVRVLARARAGARARARLRAATSVLVVDALEHRSDLIVGLLASAGLGGLEQLLAPLEPVLVAERALHKYPIGLLPRGRRQFLLFVERRRPSCKRGWQQPSR